MFPLPGPARTLQVILETRQKRTTRERHAYSPARTVVAKKASRVMHQYVTGEEAERRGRCGRSHRDPLPSHVLSISAAPSSSLQLSHVPGRLVFLVVSAVPDRCRTGGGAAMHLWIHFAGGPGTDCHAARQKDRKEVPVDNLTFDLQSYLEVGAGLVLPPMETNQTHPTTFSAVNRHVCLRRW